MELKPKKVTFIVLNKYSPNTLQGKNNIATKAFIIMILTKYSSANEILNKNQLLHMIFRSPKLYYLLKKKTKAACISVKQAIQTTDRIQLNYILYK